MYVNFTEKSDDKAVFTIVGCSIALANALRRIMIADVESWAIEYVTFTKNSTVLSNPFIAHRLGLIPISVSGPPEVLAKYNDQNTISLSFSKTSGTDPEEWYGEMMQFNDMGDGVKVSFPIEQIPIVKVCKGQQLEFTAELVRGTGSQHSKWRPVSLCWSRKVPEGILFTVESVGTMPAAEIVLRSIEILRTQLKECKNDMQVETL